MNVRRACRRVTAVQEQYIEAVDEIVRAQGAARVKDVASALEVKAPSAIGMLRTLAELGLIKYEPRALIVLTAKGRDLARGLSSRHRALFRFLNEVLGISDDEADEAACAIEHVVSPLIAERFLQYAEYIGICPRGGPRFIEGAGYRCVEQKPLGGCKECVTLP